MKIFLVGHRGVGKTSLLRRISQQKLFSGNFLDLDEEIEKKFGPLADIFKNEGEASFRETEKEVLFDLYKTQKNAFISLGAGFDINLLPDDDFVLWVRRDSDLKGRIFLNRPRLEKDLDPLSEYKKRALIREKIFSERADAVYTMPEGLWFSEVTERKILEKIFSKFFRIEKESSPIKEIGIETRPFSSRFKKQMGSYVEIRSDQWSMEEILKFQDEEQPKIYSHRSPAPLEINLNPDKWDYLDWDIDYGKVPWEKVEPRKIILSTHADSIEKGIIQLNESACYSDYLLKLCPKIETWDELAQGYRWWAHDPEHRSFLPRSQDGRWLWFRLWMKGKQKLNFFRQGPALVPDQPSLYQWENTPLVFQEFAAVLGAPVDHSYSPSFHSSFFLAHKIPFFPIEVHKAELSVALVLLRKMGLSFAAVTSPLKREAFLNCKPFSSLERNLEAINTLTLNQEIQEWIGHNTDLQGFEESFQKASSEIPESLQDKDILLWGGGGILNMIKSVRPEVEAVKARQGLQEKSLGRPAPRVIIWGSPRTQDVVWPPTPWQPQLIFDLNYTADSMGLELAERYDAKYFSGLLMFEVQAKAQQKIWSDYL